MQRNFDHEAFGGVQRPTSLRPPPLPFESGGRGVVNADRGTPVRPERRPWGRRPG